MVERTETVGVRLTPDEREQFETFVKDNNECGSLSQFFRLAAYNFTSDDEEDVSLDPEEIIEAVDVGIAPVTERLDELEEHVLSIDSRVNDDDKIDKLARDIYSALPVHQSASDLPDIHNLDELNDASDFVLTQKISTPYLWSQYFDEDVADVRRACSRMEEYYPDVEFVREDLDRENRESVPSFSDIDVSTSVPHTDFSNHDSGPEKTQSTTSRSKGNRTERRYYKTRE
ncbi:hypothetical protein BRC71_08460 [Halobacteriales archaeon QH_7_65_31]|nr:MAG: hypothetical protein BRC71_08460 [Halobacteriales archaeon QH_7_65_31]